MRLPIVDPRELSTRDGRLPPRAAAGGFDSACHLGRLLLLAALVLGLNRLSARWANRPANQATPRLSVAAVREVEPRVVRLQPIEGRFENILDNEGVLLGSATTTSPTADEVIGYSGPNDVLLILDLNRNIVSASLLHSGDTQDHVALVRSNAAFWQQFRGLTWGSRLDTRIDGVSGATLTSLAIAEAIALRISGQKPSLRFAEAVSLDEAKELVSELERMLAPETPDAMTWEAIDATGQSLGVIVRTGPLVDSVEGYQGPSELLMWIAPDGNLLNVRLRRSYDNEPYVGYVKQESSFWRIFKNRSLQELAELDLDAEKIEGVSGATMTSQAVARTIQESTAAMTKPVPSLQASRGANKIWNWSATEIATLVLALAAVGWSRSHMRSRKLPRFIWQAICFLVLGLAAGNLLSLTLFAGWIRGGVPFHLAPGLTVLIVVSLVWPALTKSNVYCDHLCPHGVLQQWLRIVRIRRGRWPRRGGQVIAMTLRALRFACLGAVLASLALNLPLCFAWLEPFNAYLWQIGFSISLIIWLASLLIAWWWPMAYCQHACPTGKILDIVRRSRRHQRSWQVDAVLAGLVVLIWIA
jgi:NosR/NirI family transcriptional regulator, nitrous oxide reductase regulator